MRLTDHEYNRQLLLKKLRANEPVARTDLVALTGLTGGTITAITADLLRKGLVIEEKVAARSPGRPRVNLRINPAGKYVVGSTLMIDGELVVEIVNLIGETLHRRIYTVEPTTRLDALAHQFAARIRDAIESSPIDKRLIDRVGVGLPAVVDNRSGVVETMISFEPGPCPFAEIVQSDIGIATSVDNNLNLLARAEHWFGDGGDDFTLILIDLGVGAALYQGGNLATGAHGIEPEFGHVKIVLEGGRPCHCGAKGCLQAYSSISGIVEQYCEAVGAAIPDIQQMPARFDAIAEGMRDQDRTAQEIFRKSARYFGIAVANHINMQDPQRIIVLSALSERMRDFREDFARALEENTFPTLRGRAQIQNRETDYALYARGAAAMLLEQIYSAR